MLSIRVTTQLGRPLCRLVVETCRPRSSCTETAVPCRIHSKGPSMRKLIASTFVSLDGVLQGPGAPEEDTTGGFALGGWTYSFWDEAMGESMDGFDAKGRELLLG